MQSSVRILVRRAIRADLDCVVEIDRTTPYASHWSRSAYEKYESEPREDFFHRCFLVAVEDGSLVGFIAGSFLEGDEVAMLENLAVDAGWRRKGIAKALCGAFADWAESEGAWGVHLEVRESNEGARALYAGLQFVEKGSRKNYYSDPEEDAVLMARKWR